MLTPLLKSIVGTLVGILILAGSAWVTYVQGQVGDMNRKMDERNGVQAEQAKDLAVIKEQVRQIRENADRQERNQADMNRKLDDLRELLRPKSGK